MKVELLYWRGCPSYPEAQRLIEEVLARAGVEAAVELREVESDEQAARLRFPGSPTIRIDGRDVDPVGAETPPGLTCRLYHLPDGRISPLPTREQIDAALA
ncbi:MAG: thioredoxin family protein [Thermoleophilia bacterium]|nr:thioredoxin family protein [Thermoleophilia bacterium]